MATLKEIADKVGVSLTTVSRVINYDETLSISPDKRKLIFEVAEDLDYETPRSKRTAKAPAKTGAGSYRIGIIHFISIDEELEDPYYLAIRIGIEKRCREYNYELIKIYDRDHNYPVDQIRSLQGLITVGKFSSDDIMLFKTCCKNTVTVDSSPCEDQLDSVVVDVNRAMNKVLTFALRQGFTKIGYFGWTENGGLIKDYPEEKRHAAFVEYLTEKNLFKSEYVYENAEYSQSRGGYQLFRQAYEEKNLPELIIAGNDSEAIGIMRAIHETGLRIPEDISVIGMNDIPIAQYTFPPLTTVKFYSEFMGKTAVDLLKERFENRIISKKVIIPCQLVVRESCRLLPETAQEETNV